MAGSAGERSGFWNAPATWKAFLFVAGYLVYYLVVSQLVGLLFGDEIDTDNPLADASSMFFALVLPIGFGAIGLLVFAVRVGWPQILGLSRSLAAAGCRRRPHPRKGHQSRRGRSSHPCMTRVARGSLLATGLRSPGLGRRSVPTSRRLLRRSVRALREQARVAKAPP